MATKPFFCEECSTRNTPDSKYCKECGASLHAAYQTLALSDHDRIDDPTNQERLTQFLDMAFWHSEAGNVDAAVRACKAALALNANSTTALSLLGTLCERQGDDAQAIGYFERVLALNPDSAADRIKLNQLQEGVHVAPVRASPVYRWLPPAFGTAGFSEFALAMRERWASLRRPEMPLLPARTTPALAAGVAAVFVITAGLFLIKPSPSVSAEPATTVQPVAKSAYGGASPTTDTAPPAPTIPPLIQLPARPGTPLAPLPSLVASAPPADPFAGQTPVAAPTGSGYGSPRARRAASGRLHALPALVAVPAAGSGPLPPAPVSIEANAPIPANANIARHTVIVHRLNGLSEFTVPTASPSSDSSDVDNSGQGMPYTNQGPPSNIQITVDPSTGGAQGASADNGNTQAGESDQQSAFSLQQQGHYRQAAALYGRAIAAYQAQMSSGQDVDAAQRGLQACQTGLQICRQSQ